MIDSFLIQQGRITDILKQMDGKRKDGSHHSPSVRNEKRRDTKSHSKKLERKGNARIMNAAVSKLEGNPHLNSADATGILVRAEAGWGSNCSLFIPSPAPTDKYRNRKITGKIFIRRKERDKVPPLDKNMKQNQ